MDWVESVREIRKANENNRLVVFVGAGVSKNSGIPTWGELIQDIAKKIGYSHCNVCKEKKPCSKEADCKERFSFTQDEYLRIPEYYFIQDHSEKHKAYYQLLQDSLGSGGSANAIDEEIFSLLPNHIVTTNYDNLHAANINKMEEELEKHEKRYNSGGSSFFTGHAHFHIMKIQAYAYEYYRFFMRNYLPIHCFQNPENYFSPYLRSILCSYTPVPVLSSKDLFVKTHRASFPLNEIDFDMFVKFTKPKTLKAWFKEYHVKNIELDSSINVAQKFENLCKSLKIAQDSTWFTQLHCFCVMCCYLNLSDNEQERVFSALVTALCDFRKTNMAALGELLEPLLYLLRFCLQDKCENEKRKLLEELLQPEVQESLQNHYGQAMLDILDLLACSISNDKKIWLQQQIELLGNETLRFRRAYAWRNLLAPTFLNKIMEKNISNLTPIQIFELLVEKHMDFSENLFTQLLKTLEEEHIKRQQIPGVRSFPDQLLEAINCCIIIKLNGHDIDIKKLEPYVQYSDQLRFMLDPQTFDYKLVDTRDSMWQNLIFSDLYKPFFIQHKKELLSEQLEEIWRNGLETPWQQRIVYGILLDKDELIQFGRP